MVLDKVGNELNVGDEVIFNPPHYKGLVFGEIVKMTPKGAKIKFEVTHHRQGDGVYFVTGDNIVKNVNG